MVLRLWISTTRRWISYEEKANRRAWAVPSADKVWYTVDFIYATTRSAMHWYASLDIQDIAFKSNLESALMNNGRWEVRRRGVRMKCRPWSLCGRLSPANLVSTPTRCLPISYRLLWFLPIYNHCDFYVFGQSHQQTLYSSLSVNVSKHPHRDKIVLAR